MSFYCYRALIFSLQCPCFFTFFPFISPQPFFILLHRVSKKRGFDLFMDSFFIFMYFPGLSGCGGISCFSSCWDARQKSGFRSIEPCGGGRECVLGVVIYYPGNVQQASEVTGCVYYRSVTQLMGSWELAASLM